MAAHQAPPSLGFSRQEHWSGWPEQALSTGGDHTPLCDLFANCTKARHQPQAPAFLESGLVNSRKALRGVTVREVEIRSLGSQPWPLAGCGILNKSLYLLNFRFIICHKCQYKQNRVMISAEDVGMWPRCWGPSESTGSPGWGAVPSFWLGRSRRAGSIQACLPASHCIPSHPTSLHLGSRSRLSCQDQWGPKEDNGPCVSGSRRNTSQVLFCFF